MTLRKVPGSLALGLLASLVAHTALYGGGHIVGGAYHGALLQAAVAASLGLLVFFGLLAWGGAAGAADGSILAARMNERLPGFTYVATSAAIWFGIAEWLEPHHAGAAPSLLLLGLAIASWLVLRVAAAVVRALAGAVIAVCRAAFAPRTPSWTPRPRAKPLVRRTLLVRRRFARPPPIAIALRA
ncbi:MAG: hypothetical protein WA814_02655 [Candidatus Baltobacteraceae bacterium]